MSLEVEVVGIVDAGIKAARWSPDDELLILITGPSPSFELTARAAIIWPSWS